MRKNITRLVVIAAALLATAATARAQQPDAIIDATGLPIGSWYVGPTAAFSRNLHTGGFRVAPGGDTTVCDCGVFQDGTGDGWQAGIAARLQVSSILALDARVTYDSRPGHFEVELPDALVIMPGTGEVVTQRTFARSDVEYDLVTIDALASLNLLRVGPVFLTVSAGPSLGFVQVGRYSQYQDLEEPPNARFTNPQGYETENEGRRLVFARDAEIPGMSSTRLSVKGGGSVDLHLLDMLLLVRAGAYYDRALSDLSSAENWQVHSTLFQLDFLVRL
jgi:hypothetical protein